MEATRRILHIFLVQERQKPEYFVRFAEFGSLFVTHGMECHKLTAGENGIDCNRVDESCAQQEEADTRIIIYASHAASNGHDCIAIKSPDTDVAVFDVAIRVMRMKTELTIWLIRMPCHIS